MILIEPEENIGERLIELAQTLYPLNRSLTGNGVRETLAILREHIPLSVYQIPSGTETFDWKVPDEWNVRSAFIADSSGNKVVDFTKHMGIR